jgi:hypothetical protein
MAGIAGMKGRQAGYPQMSQIGADEEDRTVLIRRIIASLVEM